jgi:hypothetical protein
VHVPGDPGPDDPGVGRKGAAGWYLTAPPGTPKAPPRPKTLRGFRSSHAPDRMSLRSAPVILPGCLLRFPAPHAPDRIRTCDLRLRRPTLYPAELRARGPRCGAGDRTGGRISRVLSPLSRRRIISLGRALLHASCGLPGTRVERAVPRPCLALLQVGFAVRPPLPSARCALTAPFHPCLFSIIEDGAIGGLLSVALSVGSRRPGVTRHLALGSSDFPPATHTGPTGDPHSPPDLICQSHQRRPVERQNRKFKPRREPGKAPARVVQRGNWDGPRRHSSAPTGLSTRCRRRMSAHRREEGEPPQIGGRLQESGQRIPAPSPVA